MSADIALYIFCAGMTLLLLVALDAVRNWLKSRSAVKHKQAAKIRMFDVLINQLQNRCRAIETELAAINELLAKKKQPRVSIYMPTEKPATKKTRRK